MYEILMIRQATMKLVSEKRIIHFCNVTIFASPTILKLSSHSRPFREFLVLSSWRSEAFLLLLHNRAHNQPLRNMIGCDIQYIYAMFVYSMQCLNSLLFNDNCSNITSNNVMLTKNDILFR